MCRTAWHPAGGARGAALPRLQLGVGGNLRRRAILRRPLHHAGAGRVRGRQTAVLATVAAGYVLAAVWAGWVGDRVGLARVIYYCSFLYGGGMLVAGLAQQWHDWYLALIFPVAVAGGAVMTLAWGLLFKLTPPANRGTISGLATTTKGFGLIIGPIAAGAAMDIFGRYFQSTDGYQLLWPLLSVPILAVIPLVRKLYCVEVSGRASRQPVEAEAPQLAAVHVEHGRHGASCEDARLVRAARDRDERAPAAGDRRRRGAEREPSRVPAVRLPQGPDGVDAPLSEANRSTLGVELLVVEVPRRLRAVPAAAVVRAPGSLDLRLRHAELDAAEAAPRHEDAVLRKGEGERDSEQ